MQTHQSTQCAQQLFPLFQHLLKQIKDFMAYLEQIKLAISDNDNERLNHLLSEPSLDVATIEQLQLQQQQVAADYGFEHSFDGVDACVKACHQDQLSKLSTALKSELKELQNALLINDLLIRKNQQRVRQSIRILSGHTPVNTSTTYSSSGNTTEDSLDSHSLARA